MENLNSLVGVTLIHKNNDCLIRESTDKVLKDKNIIGLYFSKYQCPECKNFLPKLNKLYKEINEKYNDFEIIFVGTNHPTESDFQMYYNKMEFIAVPFSQKDYRNKIKQKYSIRTLPSLIFINNNGETISGLGKMLVSNLKYDADKIYELLSNCNKELTENE